MTTQVELGRLDWNRANIQTADASYTGAHFWGDGATFHAETSQGVIIGALILTLNDDGFHACERLDAKRYRLTGQDGTVWTVEKGGCRTCGG